MRTINQKIKINVCKYNKLSKLNIIVIQTFFEVAKLVIVLAFTVF